MPPSVPGRGDGWSAVGLAALAVAYLVAGRRYPLDSPATPGPGVFPLLLGALLLMLAVCELLSFAWARSSGEPGGPAAASEGPAARGQGRALAMMGVLVVYAASFPVVGFLAASGLL